MFRYNFQFFSFLFSISLVINLPTSAVFRPSHPRPISLPYRNSTTHIFNNLMRVCQSYFSTLSSIHHRLHYCINQTRVPQNMSHQSISSPSTYEFIICNSKSYLTRKKLNIFLQGRVGKTCEYPPPAQTENTRHPACETQEVRKEYMKLTNKKLCKGFCTLSSND